ncbi:bifunctional adenosylcobinamide kinase/adenosylcobinamide-phosphate guanylyltransferase [Hyphomonas oceanitis]|uniref:Bifunctional adenosylcobalamin biosynthesis protein n=1 Tax=Hyphomonas oceanitis SCH89 TaxID=1280953 RepID=A0A059G7V7_9PROT|nr:bifunctional adenosylcobinamide kinase/adenosylcobinamide-phosphate guanylyltransferase [Hyphomonas oceanitis]KDA02573.1 cobinamide kinase / cobinamide phosphate guanyltransferase [Hyphomonas oceanitis SCH89]
MTATFILGGARSGKSARAQALAEAAGETRVYIATAEALDVEMEARIARHKADRGAGWRTVEAPLELVAAMDAADAPVVLVDCLTLWLSNLMHHERDVEPETQALCACLGRFEGEVILVSNEVGLGLVPETPLGRAFRDAQGRLNQRVAAACDVVEFVAAGLPLRLKG